MSPSPIPSPQKVDSRPTRVWSRTRVFPTLLKSRSTAALEAAAWREILKEGRAH